MHRRRQMSWGIPQARGARGRLTILVGLGWLATASTTAAEPPPVDLQDPTPRVVQVWFEASPGSEPGRLAAVFEGPFPARLAPGPVAGEVTLRVGADVVERHLLNDHAPVPGSFSDFVWHVDAQTGAVRWAGLEGEVVQPVSLGLAVIQARTRIRVDMSSDKPAGYRKPVRRFGHRVFRYCDPAEDRSCRSVPAHGYDPATGYVNAVGRVSASMGVFRVDTFSPLGEARFRELDTATAAWRPGARDLR